MIVEPTQFIFIKIIFGDGNILFAHFLASPTGKSHIRFGGICPVINDFSGGRSSDCPMEFVLHGLEKIDAGFGCGIVIDTCGIDIGYFLIKSLFRGTDILDATQKFIKIIKWLIRVFQPPIVKNKTLDNIFPQPPGCPLAESSGNMGFYAITDRDAHIQTVEFRSVIFAIGSSC